MDSLKYQERRLGLNNRNQTGRKCDEGNEHHKSSEIAPWIKEPATQADLHGEAKGPTPRHCPLTSTHTPCMAHAWTRVRPCVHAHTHTQMKE